ncbi:hypothetical protein RHGRI_035150 [Rhododendron griersonianum]|uniref:PGG domain-containing protein n=1 Tax=Rhododendron griersonianum TaxID=479676 RepID=A0AAV6I3V2_9ERIC|nr:hypothetical protein RHGRI_035150 [Rhododendron griersonianum]
MKEIEDVGRRLKEACLSGSVATLDALVEDDELILDRVSSLSGFFNDSPLHVVALRGHLDFTKALLQRKPKLVTELDLLRRLPLHLASAEGHVEIVRELTIEYLLGIKIVKDQANVKNQNGFTALDIVEYYPIRDLRTMEIKELLLQAGVHKSFYMRLDSNPGSPPPDNPPTPPRRWCKARDWISMFWKKYFKYDHGWLQQVRGHLITAATLTATVAYESIMSPPGGFWQDSNNGHKAGEAILDSYHSPHFARYLVINTAMLIASCITIMLALTGFPIHNKFLIWVLVFTVYITLSCMVGAYVLAIIVLTPNVEEDFKPSLKISVGLELCWMGICGFVAVLHAFHFLAWLRNKFRSLVTPYRSHKCMGNFC